MEGSKILVIIENTKIRNKVAEVLTLARYNIVTASSGKIGVELVRQQSFDLILCNINMKEIDGFGVLSVLNKFSETIGIQFIFLIKERQVNEIRRAMELGADGYLFIPFNSAELLNTVQVHIKKNIPSRRY